MTTLEVYLGSDGEATKALYAELQTHGPIGEVALNLFRAQKSSARAKVYRGGRRGVGSFKGAAYEKKSWSMDNLCAILGKHGQELGIRYGWLADPDVVFGERASFVLYVDLPNGQGQVSFHSPTCGAGPEYRDKWDGRHQSQARIIQFVDRVLGRELEIPGTVQAAYPEQDEVCQRRDPDVRVETQLTLE